MRNDETTEQLAKALCRSLMNEHDAQSGVDSVEEALEGLAYAMSQGWIDTSIQLTDAGRHVAMLSQTGKLRGRVLSVAT
jgi:hypothetical protein